MEELTREQFWSVADDVFGSAHATGVRDAEASCPGCGATGPVRRGSEQWTVRFLGCGHVFRLSESLTRPTL